MDMLLNETEGEVMDWEDFTPDFETDPEDCGEVEPDDHLESDYDDRYCLDNYEDDGEALASCGWGTDEDYGCYGGEEW